jgi:hypothetical protein
VEDFTRLHRRMCQLQRPAPRVLRIARIAHNRCLPGLNDNSPCPRGVGRGCVVSVCYAAVTGWGRRTAKLRGWRVAASAG